MTTGIEIFDQQFIDVSIKIEFCFCIQQGVQCWFVVGSPQILPVIKQMNLFEFAVGVMLFDGNRSLKLQLPARWRCSNRKRLKVSLAPCVCAMASDNA